MNLSRATVIVAIYTLTFSIGCKSGKPSNGSTPVQVSSPHADQVPVPVQSSNLGQEASIQAANHWNLLYTVCGGTRFSQIFYGPAYGDKKGFQSLYEWQGLNWNVLARPLSDADRLNQIDWDGTSEVHTVAYRVQLKGQGWRPWVQFNNFTVARRLIMTKVMGQWRLHEDNVGDSSEVPINCQEVSNISAGLSQSSTSSVPDPLYDAVFQSVPNGATVTVDGKVRGVTGDSGTLTVQLTAGHHQATLSMTGFPSVTESDILMTPNTGTAFLFDLKTAQQGEQRKQVEKAQALFDQKRYDEAYAVCDDVLKVGLQYDCVGLKSRIDKIRSGR